MCPRCSGPVPLSCSLPLCPFGGILLPSYQPELDRQIVRCATDGCHNEASPLDGLRCRRCADMVGLVGHERPLKPIPTIERR